MKKTISLLSNLLLSSTLFLGVPTAEAESVVLKTPLDLAGYCHMQFPPIRKDTLNWDQPVLDEGSGNVIDFYGSCDHDPLGPDEIRAQKRAHSRAESSDGDNGDSD
ncbi:MAG: hypothetical protein OEN50_14765 [Deltaproteobacteria bacterium]|nr:hypothetical protein [Deltaproteobacteria bacterium]